MLPEFIDPDGRPHLRRSLAVARNPLPDWLSFDPDTRTFTRHASERTSGSFTYKYCVSVSDGQAAVRTVTFTLTVVLPPNRPRVGDTGYSWQSGSEDIASV